VSDDAAFYPGLDPLTEEYDKKQMELVMAARVDARLPLSVRYGPANPYGSKGIDQAALANAWAEGAQHGYELAMLLVQQAREAE
jgi:hypothetical protein